MVIYRTQFFTAGTIKHGLEPGLLSIRVTMVTEIPGDFIPENILFHPCWEHSAALGDESNSLSKLDPARILGLCMWEVTSVNKVLL